MSLILEALRKSEAERRRGQSPDLYAPLPPVPPTPQRSNAPWLWGAAALAVAAGIGLWSLRSGTESRSGPPASAATKTPRDAAAGEAGRREPPAAAAAQADKVSMPPAAVAADAGNAAAAAAVDGAAAVAPPASAASSAPAPATLPPGPGPTAATPVSAASAAADPRPASAPPAAVSLPAPSASAPAVASIPAPKPLPASAPEPPIVIPVAQAPAPAARPAGEGGAMRLADLSPEARKQLPPLKLSMHMWNEEPARRFVIVDGQRLGEGDRIGDAVLVAIRPDGALIDWNGRRLQLPLR